ncbi:MAG TPA: glycosyltransferase [Polyangiaceae bacterium]|nr:glycosyltransferase [Polyangiaceae bacterium]
MPRVALFCTNFLPYSQAFVHEQLRQHQRYEAEVFCWRRFYPERFPFEPLHIAPRHYILTRRSPTFTRRFREQTFNVVHAHFGPGACYALPFAEQAKLPLIVTFHGYDVPLLSSPRRFLPINLPYALRAPAMLKKMALGLCASQELFDMLVDLGVPKNQLRVFRLGIDLNRFVPAEKSKGEPLVAMIGRFVEKKGFEYGIEAFAQAAKSSAARLVIAGNGPLEGKLRALVAQLGIEQQVSFPGPLTQSQVAALLAQAAVLLAPSVVASGGNRESGLIVVKEASACGAVPIGSRHGGIPEIIDDEVTGFLVPERDAQQLAERLRQVLTDPALRERLAAQGQAKMRREYDNTQRVQELEAIYDEVALGRPS